MGDTVVKTVLHMFEHWDGSGGPEGLRPLRAAARNAGARSRSIRYAGRQ